MTTYSGLVDCYCGTQHSVSGVQSNFVRYSVSCQFGRSFLVRHVECARCLKIEFEVKWNYHDSLIGQKHLEEYICNECKPIVLKNHMDKFDGVSPGTSHILEKLNECLNRIANIEARLTKLEERNISFEDL